MCMIRLRQFEFLNVSYIHYSAHSQNGCFRGLCHATHKLKYGLSTMYNECGQTRTNARNHLCAMHKQPQIVSLLF